jgi:hypothetical protein
VTDARPPRSVRVTMRAAVLICGLAVIAAAGCGDDGDARPGGGSARLSEPITFEVVGGDAFRDDEMTVRADGSARIETRSGKRTADLTADELSALAREVEQADLAKVPSAVTEPPRPDALWYRVTYRGRQVETDQPAMPEQLRPLIGNFIGLIDRYRPE